MSEFAGFVDLTQNWFRVPNVITDEIMCTLKKGEIIVLLFIIRNTVGFSDDTKHITLDEFEHGRKRRDGTRLSSGTGLSQNTIMEALRSLRKRGFIKRTKVGSDRGRLKCYYSLRKVSELSDVEVVELAEDVTSTSNFEDQTHENCTSKFEVQILKNCGTDPQNLRTDQRNTLRGNTLKERNVATPTESATSCVEGEPNEHDDYGTRGSKSNGTRGSKSNGTIIKEEDIKEEDIKERNVATPTESATSCVEGEPTSSKTKPTPFDRKACEHFVQTLKLAGVNPGRKDASKWLHQFRLLRTYDGATESDIRLTLKWYRLYYPANKGTQYTIVAHSARAFREKFFDKLLPKAQAANKINSNTVNGIRPITIYDVEQAHRKDSDWGSTYLFIDYQEWDLAAYHRDKRSCYPLMAELVNDQRHDRPELVRSCLQKVGLTGAIVDEN